MATSGKKNRTRKAKRKRKAKRPTGSAEAGEDTEPAASEDPDAAETGSQPAAAETSSEPTGSHDAEEPAADAVAPADDAVESADEPTEPDADKDPAAGTAEPAADTVEPATDTVEAPATEAVQPADEVDDVGTTSTPEARARLLAEALAHAEMQEARYRVPTASRRVARIKTGIALVVFLLAGGLALAPPDLVVPDPPSAVEPADLEAGLLSALLLQAQQVDAFRATERRLPASLDELAETVPGIRYLRSSGRVYQLIAYTRDGRAVVYDSAAPAPVFRDHVPEWRGPEGSR